ncbi:MAG: zinc-binding alcohol dehydrogenase [Rhizorhabdus sp.]|nr:zinc-binding alcohol dehydrogenase [Rhizorhabdus sp.]
MPIRFVQVGTASGADISLPGAVLRSSAIELMGSGIGSVSLDRLVAAVDGVLRAAASHGLGLDAEAIPLSDVERTWSLGDGRRTVFTLP